jgi:predicted phosphodiesterase
MPFTARLFLTLTALAAAAAAQTVLVKPYVQPGNGATLDGTDVKVLTWLTDQKPGEFTVEFTVPGQPVQTVKPQRLQLDFAPPKMKAAPKKPDDKGKPPEPAKSPALSVDDIKDIVTRDTSPVIPEKAQHFFRYRAELAGLPFDSKVTYRVALGDAVVREGAFTTRASAEKPVRFVAVGDLANGKPEQNRIAHQISLQKPDFLVALGDIVYSGGRVSQYLHHFWTTYNDVDKPGEKTGAPLMASIPFYPVLGNHDADNSKLPEIPDAFGAFYFFSVPKNGPGIGPWITPLGKDAKVANAFRAAAGAEYPALNGYSFDYGPAHFLCLDSNSYTVVEALQAWVEKDLRASRQPWKFVCFHAPAFHTSPQHYSEQKLRLLAPVFERCGVDVVFAGHVHNYQRTKPLHFTPNPPRRDPRGRVNGDFVIDRAFDGKTNTSPKGVIHIVSGGGGATLYKMDFPKTVARLIAESPANYQPFTEKFDADRHSFSVVELTTTTFDLRQIGIGGEEIDRFRITKSAQ